MGAVSTTFMAGVEAIKRGLGQPIGSLTQLGTVRLGKRTDARTPKIQDFVPLARMEDLVFGGWDIFEDNAYESAVHASVLETSLLEKIREPLEAIQAHEGGVRRRLCTPAAWAQCERSRLENGQGRDADG